MAVTYTGRGWAVECIFVAFISTTGGGFPVRHKRLRTLRIVMGCVTITVSRCYLGKEAVPKLGGNIHVQSCWSKFLWYAYAGDGTLIFVLCTYLATVNCIFLLRILGVKLGRCFEGGT